MTKQEWQALEEKLSGAYASQKFEIDGYNITVEKGVSKNRLFYCIYINGWCKGEWLDKKNEEFEPFRTKFLNEKKMRLYSPSKKAKMLEGIPKKSHKKMIEDFDLDKSFTYHSPYFYSFSALKNKFIKNNKSIKLINEQ
jgi:hypothetical protein